ncbi:MAG: hypothetical protein ACREVS_06120, partial [Burkholderiales bacterium]
MITTTATTATIWDAAKFARLRRRAADLGTLARALSEDLRKARDDKQRLDSLAEEQGRGHVYRRTGEEGHAVIEQRQRGPAPAVAQAQARVRADVDELVRRERALEVERRPLVELLARLSVFLRDRGVDPDALGVPAERPRPAWTGSPATPALLADIRG